MKKLLPELSGLVWSAAGAGFVIITLDGATRRNAIVITAVAVFTQIASILLGDDE